MKKTVKSVCDFLTANSGFEQEFSEKTRAEYCEKLPKIALLSCPDSLRYLGDCANSVYPITSYGGTVGGNEITLDYAVKTLELPVLIILGHEDCSAVKRALKEEPVTKNEAALFNAIIPGFDGGKSRKFRDNIFKHMDYQISLLLERYRALVKGEQLLVMGVFCDAKGVFHITNYNGLRGLENLVQALPDVDVNLFLG